MFFMVNMIRSRPKPLTDEDTLSGLTKDSKEFKKRFL